MSPPGDGGGIPSLRGLVGSSPERLLRERGASADRRAGESRWLVFRVGGATLRVRTEGRGPEERVASWTLTFGTDLPRSLGEAARRAGLWPELAPEETAREGEGIIRRALESPGEGPTHTATATCRGGRILRLAAFDEPPEWER